MPFILYISNRGMHINGNWLFSLYIYVCVYVLCMRVYVCVGVGVMMSFRFHDNVKFPFEIHAHCFFGHSSIFCTQFLQCPSVLSFYFRIFLSLYLLFFLLCLFACLFVSFLSFLFRIIYFMWWNTWTVVIWCFTFKFRDALLNIKQNSLAPKSYRDWNFYIRWESFIGMCNDMKSKSKEWNLEREKKAQKRTKNQTNSTYYITTMDCMSSVFVEWLRSNKTKRLKSIMAMEEYRRLIKQNRVEYVQRLNQKRNEVRHTLTHSHTHASNIDTYIRERAHAGTLIHRQVK